MKNHLSSFLEVQDDRATGLGSPRQHALLLVSCPVGRWCLISDRNWSLQTPSLVPALCWDGSQLGGRSKNLRNIPFAFSVTLSPPCSLIPGASLLREWGGPVVGLSDLSHLAAVIQQLNDVYELFCLLTRKTGPHGYLPHPVVGLECGQANRLAQVLSRYQFKVKLLR